MAIYTRIMPCIAVWQPSDSVRAAVSRASPGRGSAARRGPPCPAHAAARSHLRARAVSSAATRAVATRSQSAATQTRLHRSNGRFLNLVIRVHSALGGARRLFVHQFQVLLFGAPNGGANVHGHRNHLVIRRIGGWSGRARVEVRTRRRVRTRALYYF